MISQIMTYLSFNVRLDMSAVPGLPKPSTVGQAVLTNVGMMGFEQGFAPLPTPCYSMLCGCMGTMRKIPVAIDGKLVPRTMVNLTIAMDHRFGDAGLAEKFIRILKSYVENPESFNIDEWE